MLLNINDDRAYEDPDPERVRDEVIGMELESFLILSRAEENYVQAMRNDDGTIQLEYRAGSEDEHYEAVDDVTLEEVARVFVGYLADNADWNEGLRWEPMEFEDEDFDDNFDEDFLENEDDDEDDGFDDD